jgi:hypothetical protein
MSTTNISIGNARLAITHSRHPEKELFQNAGFHEITNKSNAMHQLRACSEQPRLGTMSILRSAPQDWMQLCELPVGTNELEKQRRGN